MPRALRLCIAGMPFHVVQRGNNRSACFFSDSDREVYLECLREQSSRHRVAVHAYVLMSNHVHLLITPEREHGLSELMKHLSQRYVQYVNRKYERTGSLWQGRFYSCLVDAESYLLACHRYIEMNPVRANLVSEPSAYRWSSYRANAFGEPCSLLQPHSIMATLGRTQPERQLAYVELFKAEPRPEELDAIRTMTNGGFVLGGTEFRKKVAFTLGRRPGPLKAGRPLKEPIIGV